MPSSFCLSIINLFLGMTRGVRGLPVDLRRLGYTDRSIELVFTNQEGRTVKPELILSSSRLRHTILLECKSGANTDAEQLERYSKVSSNDLQTKALLQSQEWESHDVAIVGKSEHADRLKIGIENRFRFPLLTLSPSGINKILNKFTPVETEAVFARGLDFTPEDIPHYFFPVDKDSELWEFAEILMPVVLESMLQRKTRIEAYEIAGSIIPTWDIIDTSYRGEIENKVRDVLLAASQGPFKKYLKRNKAAEGRSHTPTWDIIFNPLELDADKRSAEWRRLAKQQVDFVHTLKSGKPTIQEELF